jgi:exodeoxyribonuclease V beta subunit
MDFADIEETALGLLAHLPDRDYLSYRMGSEMRHILIDEFQDTSELQWEALRPLVNRSIALGGTVFYVGDEKQSIYRWRGGQPSLFEEVRGELRLEKQRLAYSYRQSGTVLDFVNSVFTRIGSALGPSFSYEPQELPADRSGERFGYVSVTEAEQKDTLVDQICDRIDGLRLDGIDLDDIAVLCRKNREIEELEKQLKRRRIPCRAAGKSRLFQDYAIQDMLSVIRFALDPGEQVHLAGLLRSPLFRWSYEEIERARDDAGVLTLEGIGRIDAGIAERLSSLANRGRYCARCMKS